MRLKQQPIHLWSCPLAAQSCVPEEMFIDLALTRVLYCETKVLICRKVAHDVQKALPPSHIWQILTKDGFGPRFFFSAFSFSSNSMFSLSIKVIKVLHLLCSSWAMNKVVFNTQFNDGYNTENSHTPPHQDSKKGAGGDTVSSNVNSHALTPRPILLNLGMSMKQARLYVYNGQNCPRTSRKNHLKWQRMISTHRRQSSSCSRSTILAYGCWLPGKSSRETEQIPVWRLHSAHCQVGILWVLRAIGLWKIV